ncbi:MAG: TolC family protein [Verrucomicrobia bacterium]|nr:TolC family protein [Verrucomicrobiota bacterium]MBS0637610.1 TolC family protein [Verrucomicrobiota bacterium]
MWVIFIILIFVAGCSRVPEANDQQVAALVHERIAKQVSWQKEAPTSFVDEELDCERAIQLALLYNPTVQMRFEELGIAQADLVQAGLFQNPIFSGYFRFPLNETSVVNREFSLSQNFMELFLIPLRKKIASTELKKVEYKIAQMVVELAFDIKEVFSLVQQEYVKLELLEKLAEAKLLSQTIAMRQYKAANINELMLQQKIEPALLAQLALYESKEKIIRLRLKLNTLLGFTAHTIKRGDYRLSDLPDLHTLEDTAERQRLDLQEARFDIERIVNMYATKKWWAYSEPAVGVSYEKDADGIKVLGPSYNLALPLFDHGQADRARVWAAIRHSQYALKAKELETINEVKKAYELVKNSHDRMTIIQKKLLPLEETLLALSQKYYNVMGLSIYSFLQTKEKELEIRIAQSDLIQEYIQQKVALERAVGGYIP